MKEIMDIIEKRRAAQLLVTLLEEGPMSFSQIHSFTKGSPRTLMDRIEELTSNGLIKQHAKKEFPFTKTIQLTQKGEKYARLIRHIYTKPKLSQSESRLLSLLYYLDGTIKGTTRLEKLPFLLEKEGNIKIGDYVYSPEKFGPYSIDVLADMDELCEMGLVDIEEEIVTVEEDKEVIRRSYVLTDRGKSIAKNAFEALDEITKKAYSILDRYNNMPLKDLLEYVHRKYPEFHSKIDKSG